MEKELNPIFIFFVFMCFMLLLISLEQKLNYNEKAEGIANPSSGNVISPSVSSPPASYSPPSPRPVGPSAPVIPLVIDYAKLETILSKNSMINALPEDSKLLLKFYNFNSGERQWEKLFIIQKGIIKETTNPNEVADIVLLLHSKYIPELTEANFCSIVQKANANKDLGFETALSKVALAWKFKSMYAYRDCFGF
jgi:hypothetical protein